MIIKQDRNKDKAIANAEKAWGDIVQDLLSKHEYIFFSGLGNGFVYKPISRKDYRKIILADEVPVIQKEDEICAMSVVYPENVDWDDMEAGIPTLLCKEIIKNSYLEDPADIADLIEVFREDMIDLPTQMGCIISEAFPNYDIDEIESWNMIKFCKIFSRAEWKIKNLREGQAINERFGNVTEILRDAIGEGNYIEDEVENEEPVSQPIQQPSQPKPQETPNNVKVGNRQMTEKEYKEYLDFQRRFPEIAWDKDSMYTGTETLSYNNLPVALRPLS